MGDPTSLWLLLLFAVVLPRFAVARSVLRPCNNQCSLDEINVFLGNCCPVRCVDGVYQNLPNGIDASDSLPWWTCEDISDAYIFFLLSTMSMWILYMNFWFWYNGYALIPTSIVELSRNTTATTNDALFGISRLSRGPKTTLSGWRVIRNVNLSSKTAPCDDEQKQLQKQQQQQASVIKYDYSATIELYNTNERPNTTIPLKSYTAYKQLLEYCEARQGKCWVITTTNRLEPTNGYHLITFAPDHNDLFLYRPYFYHPGWKFQCLVFSIPPIVAMLGFWRAIPVLRTFAIIVLTNVIAFLISGMGFFLHGHHGMGGQCPVAMEDRPKNWEYIEMQYTGGGLTPVV